MVDTKDLKSFGQKCPCEFESRFEHNFFNRISYNRRKSGFCLLHLFTFSCGFQAPDRDTGNNLIINAGQPIFFGLTLPAKANALNIPLERQQPTDPKPALRAHHYQHPYPLLRHLSAATARKLVQNASHPVKTNLYNSKYAGRSLLMAYRPVYCLLLIYRLFRPLSDCSVSLFFLSI